jgi:Uma2 family endonuclease
VRLELVNGQIAVSPSIYPEHSYVDQMPSLFLGLHIRKCKLGRIYGSVGIVFGRYDIRRADIIYFSIDSLQFIDKKAIEGPPDLCVEILSPGSTKIDRKDKFKQYEKGGVAHYWIVDPEEKSIEAFELVRGKYRAVGDGKDDEVVQLSPFDDLKIPLGELWQPD